MMNLKDIQAAAGAIGNQLGAGIPMHDALKRMVRFQPKHASLWQLAADGIASGGRLSTYLEEQWPEAIVASIKAGEASGKLPATFKRIKATIAIQRDVQQMIKRVAYPIFAGLAGLGIFVFYMIKVLPELAKNLQTKDKNFFFTLSEWMSKNFYENWMAVTAATVLIIVGVLTWFSSPYNRAKVLDFFIKVPVFKDALKNIYFSIWSEYMALTYEAAIPVQTGLTMTATLLPYSLQQGMFKLADDVVLKGLADAADPDAQPDGDPRKEWPFYVSNAFLVSQETGMLSDELRAASSAMLEDGKEKFSLAMNIATYTALAFSAMFIVTPLVAYYMQLGAALTDAMKG